MKLSFDLPQFMCPQSVRPHLVKTFAGEYDVGLTFMSPRVLDLGANCGAFTLWAIHRWPGAQVQAYEPHPATFMFLRENTSAYSGVALHNYAIGNPGFRPLFEGPNNCGESSLHAMMNNPAPTGQHVEVRDPLTLPEVDILKMDIEGCEVEVLRPLIEQGRTFKAVMYEYHNDSHRRELDRLLEDYHLVGATVESPLGRGVCRYIHRSLL